MMQFWKNFTNPNSAAAAQVKKRIRFPAQRNTNYIPPAPPAAPAAPAAAGQSQNQSKWRYVPRAFGLMLALGYASTMLMGDSRDPNHLFNRSLGINTQKGYHLTVKFDRLDDKLTKYRASYISQSKGMKQAFTYNARHQVARQIGLKLESVNDQQLAEISKAAKVYRLAAEVFDAEIDAIKKDQVIVLNKMIETPQNPKSEVPEDRRKAFQRALDATIAETPEEEALRQKLMDTLNKKIKAEMVFMKVIETILKSEPATLALLKESPTVIARLKNYFLGIDSINHEFVISHLRKISMLPSYENSKVFVLHFDGNSSADQVVKLREEISAILEVADAKRGDRVVLKLNSPGGTVTGYGLAASQLLRLKAAGIKLTTCVDQVAASGGYLMACVSDKIISSPFAVIGSIGVVAVLPNFTDRLQREGVSVEDYTAGKYKRTVTMYKKPTDSDKNKMKSDLELIHKIFKEFVKKHRPNVDIENLATGETWLASEAVKLGLIDEINTADDHIISQLHHGADVYSVKAQLADEWGNPAPFSMMLSYLKSWFPILSSLASNNNNSNSLLPSFPSTEDYLQPKLQFPNDSAQPMLLDEEAAASYYFK